MAFWDCDCQCYHGTEFCSLPSVKLHQQGTRQVLCCECSGLLAFTKSGLGGGATVGMQQCKEFLKDADGTVVTNMLRSGVMLLGATVGPGEALYVPWGWLLVESVSEGSTDISGWCWTPITQRACAGVYDVVAHMLPSDPRTVHVNSKMSLLAKVTIAFRKGASDTAKTAMRAKIKDELLNQCAHVTPAEAASTVKREAPRSSSAAPPRQMQRLG